MAYTQIALFTPQAGTRIFMHYNYPHSTTASFMHRYFHPRTAIGLLCAGLGTVWAQQAADNASPNLPADGAEVIVRYAPASNNAPSAAQASQIQGTRLTTQTHATLGETLAQTPGLSSTYFGPNASRPVVRGLDGERVTILQNGSASGDVSGLSPDHATAVNTLSIERVEMLRGSSGLLYGHAVDGVINVIDRKLPKLSPFAAQEKWGTIGQTDASYSSGNAERSSAVWAQTGNAQWLLHADGFRRQSGDMGVNKALSCHQNGLSFTQNRICNSDANSGGGALALNRFFEHGHMGLSFEGFSTNYGVAAEDAVRIDMRQHKTQLQGQWRNAAASSVRTDLGLPSLSHIDFALSHNRYRHTELDAGMPATRFAVQHWHSRVDLHQSAVPIKAALNGLQWLGRSGLDAELRRFSATGDEAYAPASFTRAWRWFGFQELRGASHSLNAAWRVEHQSIRSDADASTSKFAALAVQHRPYSLALGWENRVNSQWQMHSHIARVQRAPKDYELLADGAHVATAAYEFGNAALALERFTQISTNLTWQSLDKKTKANASAFVSDYSSYIGLQATGYTNDSEGNAGRRNGLSATDCGDGTSTQSGCSAGIYREYAYASVPARFIGLELDGSHRWTKPESRTNNTIRPSNSEWQSTYRVSALRAQRRDADHTGEGLPRIAPLRFGSDLRWQQSAGLAPQGWQAQLSFDHHWAQRAVPAGDASVAPYTLWHISASYRSRFGLSPTNASTALFYVRVDNLTNTLAYSASSILTQTAPGKVPLPGRSLRAGVQWRF